MARAYPQSQPYDPEHERSSGDWQSLRHELVALLDQVDGQVARTRGGAALGERVQDLRHQLTEQEGDSRHRDALRSVQRAINRFEDPAPQQPMPPNPRDSLQAAINQIRSRQGDPLRPSDPTRALPARAPDRSLDAGLIDRLAGSVNGLSGRLERLEGEIKAQIKTGANVKDVADQVAQLAHVVELLAGAVGETGQVKRLEGQIASLGKIMSQGREMDIQTLTRRLDDVAATVGKLAELQVHYADRVQNPVETEAFQDGMQSIEQSVRAVYDRIDSLERQRVLTPQDLDQVTAQMARFTEAVGTGMAGPQNLVELIDALNTRISDMESGDRLVHALRKDLNALRDAVIVALTPRFDALEERMSGLSTRDDMAEIGRQIGALSEQFEMRGSDPGIGQVEAQVRQLVARMDQTGEQLNGLSKLYSGDPAHLPDISAMADMVASRAAEAMQRSNGAPDAAITASIDSLEQRIAAMLQASQRDPQVDAFDGVQAGINEVNERLKRLEASLLSRGSEIVAPRADIASIIERAPVEMPTPRPPRDAMTRNPADDVPLIAESFPEPRGPVASALEAKNGPRKRHPGLDEDVPLADRYDSKPPAPVPPTGFEADRVQTPPAPQPSAGFGVGAGRAEPQSVDVEPAPVSASSRNTFIEAARRAAQRQQQTNTASPAAATNSLIGRALARFQVGAPSSAAPVPAPAEKPAKVKAKVAKKAAAQPEPAPAAPTPMARDVEGAQSIEPTIAVDGPAPKPAPTESFLSRHSKVILLAAAVVAVALLTLNFVAQRFNSSDVQPAPAPAASSDAPATTGDISGSVQGAPLLGDASQPLPARVIPMVDSLKTGSIDAGAAQGFTAAAPAMPSAFTPAAPTVEVANTAPASTLPSLEPLQPEQATSPVKVDLPPENVGPADLRQAAADGDARAQFEVAAIYTEGRAVPQDYKAAATWYERAAAQGFAPAQYRLGSLYENGNGVTKDLNTARLWYERAAEAGNRMSMHNLAALYAGGGLGKQQFDSAAKWFEEAASRGLTDSQFNLGMLYARGLGVPQNLEDSYKWFGIAALSGDKDAAKARDDVARSLDADTVNKLSAEVTAFKPTPIELKANFAPIGTWSKTFDAGETITTKDIVASVQKALVKLGYDVGTPDGIAGKKTGDAIRAFEDATGMNETGQINPRLLAVLGSQPV
jgi:localization factor PodJL